MAVTTLNHYGQRAMDHMARHAPDRLAAMAHPAPYFTELGELIAEQVLDLESSLAGLAPEHETYQERVGRLNMGRLRAEEAVFAELVWPSLLDEASLSPTGSSLALPPSWDPLLSILDRTEHSETG